MTALLALIPISLLLLAAAGYALFWAARSGQFEDLDAAAIDILREENATAEPLPQAERHAD